MIAAIAGGRLQGVEAAYLARLAGWETWLLEKDPLAPASGLCSRLIPCDLRDVAQLSRAMAGADILVPALEDAAALKSLERAASTCGIPLLFDPKAYAVSSSKHKSNRLFERLGLPMPQPWPRCGLPVVVKPDGSSGSQGVQVVRAGGGVGGLVGG
jgi:pyrrolysine biosynthesis protein PylC